MRCRKIYAGLLSLVIHMMQLTAHGAGLLSQDPSPDQKDHNNANLKEAPAVGSTASSLPRWLHRYRAIGARLHTGGVPPVTGYKLPHESHIMHHCTSCAHSCKPRSSIEQPSAATSCRRVLAASQLSSSAGNHCHKTVLACGRDDACHRPHKRCQAPHC